MARAVVLAEAYLGTEAGKTANGLVLHAEQDQILAVIDSTKAGLDAGEVVFGRPLGIPVVATLAEALEQGDAEVLYVGVANVGGVLPGGFDETIETALLNGIDVVNGLHRFLGDEPRMIAAAEQGGARIHDVRRVPDDLRVMDGSILESPVPRVLVMGMDCDIGKRVTTIELVGAARARGWDAGFVATGQTGCMLAPDAGAVIDRLPGDFAAGCVEQLMLDAAQRRSGPVFTYAQASVRHPAFSGVATAILHGAAPHVVVLQVAPGRVQRALFEHPAFVVGDVLDEIALIERLGDAPVVALAVNPSDHPYPSMAIAELEEATGLPVVDPLNDDVELLLDAVLERLGRAGGTARMPRVTPMPSRGAT